MKKEFTININITVETDSDFERVEEYADQLAENIKENISISKDIEITDATIINVDGDRDDFYIQHDDEE